MTLSRMIRIHTAYSATNISEIVIHAGQEVRTGKRTDEWPGWVWCTAQSGWSAWVPESYLEIQGETAHFTRDYMAREFTVAVGEMLNVAEEVAGWLFCINSHGERGWIPAANAETIHDKF